MHTTVYDQVYRNYIIKFRKRQNYIDSKKKSGYRLGTGFLGYQKHKQK